MFDMHSRFKLNEKEVAAKMMDGEAIIINLSNGRYYSMDNVGAAFWEMLEKQYSLSECVETLQKYYEVSSATAEADIKKLASELAEEKLIIEANGVSASSNHKLQSFQDQKMPYEAPELHIYSDMGDLLALDPPTPGLQKFDLESPEKPGSRNEPQT